MIYDWYRVINMPEFLDTELVSREVTLDLEGIGEKTFLVTRGNAVSLTLDDVMLTNQMNGRNPFVFGKNAIYQDGVGDLHWGIEVEE